MATYLDAIVAFHRLQAKKDERTDAELERAIESAPSPRSFTGALCAAAQGQADSSHLAVIAEIKRRSPVTGDIRPDLDPVLLAQRYERGGASCLSVLTDEHHFGGSPEDLRAARRATELPVLRKDFTVAAHDVYDARAMGADAVLLIVAVLSDEELRSFIKLANGLDCAALVEVHDEDEVKRALSAGADLIGVNQRDLHTFSVDNERAVRVRTHIPDDVTTVAESGVRDANDVTRLADAGFDAVLVGEALVSANDQEAAVRELSAVRRASSGNA